jgi:NADH:ubiquinone oxidoreductase subunit 4 (subunit M)
MELPLLTLLILIPLLGALLILLVNGDTLFQRIALAVGLLQVLLFGVILFKTSLNSNTIYLSEKVNWFTLPLGKSGILQTHYHLLLDGLSLPLIGMSILVLLIATLASQEITNKKKGYFCYCSMRLSWVLLWRRIFCCSISSSSLCYYPCIF